MRASLLFVPLAASLLGATASAQVASFPFFDGFESGALGPHWTVTKQWGDCVGQATTANGPYSGNYHMTLDGTSASIDSNLTADLRVDLSQASSVLLEFAVRDYGDEYSTSCGKWLGAGCEYYDGVFISDDNGATWHEIFKLNDQNAGPTYQKHLIDLDVAALNAGVNYTSNFLIRFSWEDEYMIATDGFGIDEVSLRALDYATIGTIQSSSVTSNGHFGASLSGVSDVNGDGFPDLAVGHPGYLSNRGRVEIYSGKDSAFLKQATTSIFGDQFGTTLATLGDHDGDGFDELLVGAPLNDQNGASSGAAYVYSTKNGAQLQAFYGDAAGDELGAALGNAPDLDGDGLDEIVLGMPGANGLAGADCGKVRIYSSIDYSLLLEVEGSQAGERLGSSVDVYGDYDGDGKADLVTGSPVWDLVPFLQDMVGAAKVYSTGTGALLRTFQGDFSGGQFGQSVVGLGDVDGDLIADYAIGSPAHTSQTGVVRFFSGATGSLIDEDFGKAAGERFGFVLRRVGDIDGDGDEDVAAGADTDSLGTSRVYALPGLAKLADIEPIDSKTGFGSSLAGVGDLNLDGLGDLGVGAPDESVVDGSTFIGAGRVRIVSTADAPQVDSVVGVHSLSSGYAVLTGTNLLANLQVLVDGVPVTSTYVSPVEAHVDLTPVMPGGFFDLRVGTALGSQTITRGMARFPALYTPPTAALGSNVTIELENGEPGAYLLAFSGTKYAEPAPFDNFGWYYGLELNGVWTLAAGNFTAGDTYREIVITAPTAPSLAGTDFHLQAWTYQADTAVIGFTDTMTVTVTD